MPDRRTEIRLSVKECVRLPVLEEVRSGKRSQVSAARMLGITDRWVRTLVARVCQHGPAGLMHGNRGRISTRRITADLEERLIRLYRDKYDDFNLTHYREMLQERERIVNPPCREILRRLLVKAGLWSRRRQRPPHRLRRERRAREGELLQMDASIHPWLGERAVPVALVGGIDDATGVVPGAGFFEAETTAAYFRVLADTAQKVGLPQAIYSDRDSVFVISNKRQLEALRAQGQAPLTQLGRALKELDVEWIAAYSPQAKGRIERLWGTFQDRLLNELRLERIETLAGANEYLKRKFLPRFNRRFGQPASEPDPVWRPSPSWRELERILCWREMRTLSNDHTFSLDHELWQVLASEVVPALRGRRIEVRRTMRGELQAWYGAHRLRLRLAPKRVLATHVEPQSTWRSAIPGDYRMRGRFRLSRGRG